MFMGRIVELQITEWLQHQGWTIDGLEAFGEGSDIEAHVDSVNPVALEVKFIGAEDIDFGHIVESIATGPTVHTVSPQSAANFLVLKAFEAATQLQRTAAHRIALIVIDDLAWWRFDSILGNRWIDRRAPRFFDADEAWKRFFESQRLRYRVDRRSVVTETRSWV